MYGLQRCRRYEKIKMVILARWHDEASQIVIFKKINCILKAF